MKNLIYIFLFLTFVQCVNSSSPKKSNSNNEIKSEGFIELHNNDSLVLNCNDFIETELWRFIDSIDFHATSIPSKIAAYAYRDLRKSKYKNINDLIVYNINPSQHSAFEYFNSKDTLCISKIKGYYCKAKCISCKSVDCVIV